MRQVVSHIQDFLYVTLLFKTGQSTGEHRGGEFLINQAESIMNMDANADSGGIMNELEKVVNTLKKKELCRTPRKGSANFQKLPNELKGPKNE